jgi:uncharacterized membrane protein
MQPESNQLDPEQAWRDESSSAGRATQRLAAPEIQPTNLPYAAARPSFKPRQNNLLGLGLIAVGVLFILGQLLSSVNIQGGLFFLTLASGFLFFAFWRRIYGLLIPGCILAGMSFGVTFAEMTGGVFFFWGLALGFLGIYLIGRALFRMENPWPLYPAVPLFGVGLIVALAQLPAFMASGLALLPLLLIGAGLYLGFARRAS